MEVIKENNNNNKSTSNINETNTENIPQLNLEDASFQLITKDPEKKEDQSFNTSEKTDNIIQKSKIDKSTEDNSNINISKKNSIRKSSSESNERKNSISLNIEENKEEVMRTMNTKDKESEEITLLITSPHKKGRHSQNIDKNLLMNNRIKKNCVKVIKEES